MLLLNEESSKCKLLFGCCRSSHVYVVANFDSEKSGKLALIQMFHWIEFK